MDIPQVEVIDITLPTAKEYRSIRTSPNESVAAVSASGGIYIIDLEKPGPPKILKTPSITAGAIAFGPQGDFIAHVAGRYLTVFDLRTPASPTQILRRTIEGKSRCTAIAAAGSIDDFVVAIGDSSGRVRLIYKDRAEADYSWNIGTRIDVVVVTPDRRYCLFSGRNAREVARWDTVKHQGMPLPGIKSATAMQLSLDGMLLITGTADGVIHVHNIAQSKLVRTFEAHTAEIVDIHVLGLHNRAISRDASGLARIFTVRGPESTRETPLRMGDRAALFAVTPSAKRILILHDDGTLSIFDRLPAETTVVEAEVLSSEYSTKRLALVGDSGVGKSSLGWRLAYGSFKPQESTHGQQFWVLDSLSGVRPDGVEVTAVLWDFAGQPEYRLIHSLFLEDIDVALILFDASRHEEILGGVDYWIKHLRSDTGDLPDALLVGARSDRGVPSISREEVEEYCRERGITLGYLETSATTGVGLDELARRLREVIEQQPVQVTVSTVAFREIRNRVIRLKSSVDAPSKSLVSLDDLSVEVTKNIGHGVAKELLIAAVRALRNHGYLGLLSDSAGKKYVLFAPDLVISLAASVVLEARRNPKGLGALSESDVLQGKLQFPELAQLTAEQKRVLLDAVVLLFISRELCFREVLGADTFLVFPALISQANSLTRQKATTDAVTYRISGNVENVFSSLVVLLGYTNAFHRVNHWRDHAEYELDAGQVCGFRQIIRASGAVEIVLYYGEATSESARLLFQGLVEEFLKKKHVHILRFPCVVCASCSFLQERATVVRRMTEAKLFVNCEECGERNALPPVAILDLPGMVGNEVDQQHRVARGRSAYQSALVRIKSMVRDRRISSSSCFISYAWDGANDKWVHQLAKDLADADVSVVLDVSRNSAAGGSVARFIAEIEECDFILVVGTPLYKAKYANKVSDMGSIVAAEVDLIDVRMTGTEASKVTVLPVLRAGSRDKSFPPLLRGRVHYDMRQDEDYFARLFDLVLTMFKLDFGDETVQSLRGQFVV